MIYVMSDIHGNKRRFDSIMKQINLQPEDTLYVLGDVIDRHPHGGRILRQLMNMPNVQMILGNHEYMMLNALDRPFDEKDWHQEDEHLRYLYHWYRNGGEVTHAYLKHINKELRREIFDYLRKLPVNITIEVNDIKYKLVHGAPVEMYDKELRRYDDETEHAVWYRLRSHEVLPPDFVVIHGHTPTWHYQEANPLRINYGERRIGIDCGSGFPEMTYRVSEPKGRLACLRLDDMMEFYSDEIQDEGDDNDG